MEVMVAKILLKFGAAQATCRDDDDHITSQLFKSKKEKGFLRRMEPHLLMCGVPLMTNTAVQKWLASRDEAGPSLAMMKQGQGKQWCILRVSKCRSGKRCHSCCERLDCIFG